MCPGTGWDSGTAAAPQLPPSPLMFVGVTWTPLPSPHPMRIATAHTANSPGRNLIPRTSTVGLRERLDVGTVELQLGGGDIVLEVGDRPGARDRHHHGRAGQEPCEH